MYFKVFVVILNYVRPDQIQGKLPTLYKYVKYYSQPKTNESNTNKENTKDNSEARNCAINLLSNHINLFQDLLYPDCKYWYDEILRRLSRQTINYNNSAQNALKVIYRIIGKILADKNEEDTKAMLTVSREDIILNQKH